MDIEYHEYRTARLIKGEVVKGVVAVAIKKLLGEKLLEVGIKIDNHSVVIFDRKAYFCTDDFVKIGRPHDILIQDW